TVSMNSEWRRGRTSRGRRRVTKILLPACEFRAFCFHLPRTIAVDAGVYRQPAGMHPLIPQRNIKVLANLVLDFEAGLLGEGLIELFLGVAQRKLLQRIRRGIGGGRREVHETCYESSWARNARTEHRSWIALPRCARRAEDD